MSVHSHQHPVATTQHSTTQHSTTQYPTAQHPVTQHYPLRAHHSNLGSHLLHAQASHYNQNFTAHNQLPYSSQESLHHNHTYTHGQTTKHATLSKKTNANAATAVPQRQNSGRILPYSSHESPHHNHTYSHRKQATLSKVPQRQNSGCILPYSSQESPHHNRTYSHRKQATLSKVPQRQNSGRILPYSSQESPHHNHTHSHRKQATLSKNPNVNAPTAVHQRQNSRHKSLQVPQSPVAGQSTGHHSTSTMAGGSYRLLHREEIHRRDRGSLRNCTANPGNRPSKMTIPCSNPSSFKRPPTNSYEHTMEATMPTASQVDLVHTGTGNGTNERHSGSSGESSDGEGPYQHGSHDRVSPNHPMVTQATDAIEKALYGNCSGKNEVGIATKQREQVTSHHGTRGGDRQETIAEHRVHNEPQQQTDYRAFSSSRERSPLQNATEIHSKPVGTGQDTTAHVIFNIPRQITRNGDNDPQNTKRLRGVGGPRVQSSGREKVQGVRTRAETHPSKTTSRKVLFDRREFEHTRTVKGTSDSIPPGMPTDHDHSTNLHSSLPVATNKTSTIPYKMLSERADFSPNVPLPPINKRAEQSSPAHLPASNSVPTSEGQFNLNTDQCRYLSHA